MCRCETMIEHFVKCIPGGRRALSRARREQRERAKAEGTWPPQRRIRRVK